MTRYEYDDLGRPVPLPDRARRVVSLVPSLTEAIAVTAPGVLAGATDWCTHPPGLGVPRYRGTKNPDVRAIAAAAPDLVVLNKEENRELDHRRLTRAGLPVWVTVVEDVDGALRSLRRLFTVALGLPVPGWLDRAAERLGGPPPPPVTARAAICVWRDPWMVVGSGTFAGDLLRRLGIGNAYETAGSRYPRVGLDELRASGDLVILPDEPYPFGPDDGPEEFPGRARLVSGRHLTWYGPSLVEAIPALTRALQA